MVDPNTNNSQEELSVHADVLTIGPELADTLYSPSSPRFNSAFEANAPDTVEGLVIEKNDPDGTSRALALATSSFVEADYLLHSSRFLCTTRRFLTTAS